MQIKLPDNLSQKEAEIIFTKTAEYIFNAKLRREFRRLRESEGMTALEACEALEAKYDGQKKAKTIHNLVHERPVDYSTVNRHGVQIISPKS